MSSGIDTYKHNVPQLSIKYGETMNDIMTTKEAADYLKHSESALEAWRKSGNGPKWHKPSHKVIYYKQDLDDWAQNAK